MNWSKIETAPNDCKPLLVWVDTEDGGEPMILERDSKGRWLYEGEPVHCASFYLFPTHWMPLPDGPEEAKRGGNASD